VSKSLRERTVILGKFANAALNPKNPQGTGDLRLIATDKGRILRLFEDPSEQAGPYLALRLRVEEIEDPARAVPPCSSLVEVRRAVVTRGWAAFEGSVGVPLDESRRPPFRGGAANDGDDDFDMETFGEPFFIVVSPSDYCAQVTRLAKCTYSDHAVYIHPTNSPPLNPKP
jgi:hypothetical protein